MVPTNLGVASVSVSPPVLHEDVLPAGSAVSPQEVPRCELCSGGSALPARPPSVHAQVWELHLVHRDGVVLGLAVGSCDGAGGAWRWPETQEMEGGGLQRGLVRKQSLVQKTCIPVPLQVSPVPP